MSEIISAFKEIAPFLTEPLVLVGFVLMMVFSVHKQLLKSGIIQPLPKKDGSQIVRLLLRYGFWLGVLIVLAGFGLKFYEKYSETKNTSIISVGDGNAIAGRDINIYSSSDYKKLQSDLETARQHAEELQQHVDKYPNDASFQEELKTAKQNLKDAQKRQEDFKREVLKLAEDFAKIPINTERLRLAKQFFDQGNYQAARDTLNATEISQDQTALLAKQQRLQTEQSQVTTQLADNATEFLYKARLTAIDYSLPDRIAQASQFFESALKSARTPENIFAYAYFLDENNQFSAAEARYQEALRIRRQLAKDNPTVYLPDVAGTLNNLGILAANSGRRSEAESLFQEALAIDRPLAKGNPAVYLPDVARALNNLGALVKADSGRRSEAEKLYQEALGIRRQLAKDNPAVYRPDVPMALNNLGVLVAADSDRRSEAEGLYQEALEIYRPLAKD
ncbi:MAG: tetratricopeptide repeat protein, partial [Methylovulum sp.]|nr:tetratricopeptide repeat protein [Methylovulum sp.]